MARTRLFLILLTALWATPSAAQSPGGFGPDDFRIEAPDLFVEGIETEATIVCLAPEKLLETGGEVSAVINGERRTLTFLHDRAATAMTFDRREPMSVKIGGFVHVRTVNPMPLWLSVFPPLLVIGLALAFREVVSSLLIGIVSGSMIVGWYVAGSAGVGRGFLHVIDHYIIQAMTDTGHASVILFSTLIGGVVAVVSKNGGMQAIVDRISRRATTPKGGQLATWALGVAIFFDDYANTLVVGNTMRAVTDRLRISREKLAYLVDSTAAPVAAVAFITTWIGAELGYIEGALDTINHSVHHIEASPYGIFLGSLEYAFYPFYALVFMLFLILLNRDFGPMHRAESLARKHGVDPKNAGKGGAVSDEFVPVEGAPLRMANALVPIGIIVLGTVAGLLYTGYDPEIWANPDWGFGKKLSAVIGNSDSYVALLWASMSGLIVAVLMTVGQRIMKFGDTISVGIDGFKSMISAVVILVLAWSLAALTEQMHTADYLAHLATGSVPAWLIPSLTFVIAAVVSFSTGSSWGTMAIVYPIMLPLTWALSIESGVGPDVAFDLFLNTTACVLSGSVLGDHCSPISDTTILSSLATGCNHIDHVRTQLPYALTVGGVGLVFTTVAAAFDLWWYVAFPLGIVFLYLVVRFAGKRVDAGGL